MLTGAAEIEETLDRMLTATSVPYAAGDCAAAVQVLERISRRVDAVKLKVLAAADKTGTAADAGFTGTEAWVARQTTTSRSQAAREVALATQLDTGGHHATAAALDEGLVSPAHAAVILRAGRDLPSGVSDTQRQQVEAALVEKAQRFDPDQLRRIARRALEAVEPDQDTVDAHENQLLRTEEEAARDKTRLSFHDNGDGTVTGHFTVPDLAAAILRKVIESLTAPRRMRGAEKAGARPTPAPTTDRHHGRPFDWDHRRGLAFAELLEHLPTDRRTPERRHVVITIDHTVRKAR